MINNDLLKCVREKGRAKILMYIFYIRMYLNKRWRLLGSNA